MKVKVVVTGASGVLGRAVCETLGELEEVQITGLVFSRAKVGGRVVCDLTRESDVRSVLDSLKPQIIIHCAAERRPDVVDKNKDYATKLNVGSIGTIVEWSKANNCRVIFISSDYVFDGCSPPYDEESQVSPLNNYGDQKVLAEKNVLASNNVILRLPVLYGKVEYVEETAVTCLFSKVMDHSKVAPMSNFERRYPTHCGDISVTLKNMVKYWILENKSLTGVYHYQAEEEMTKLDMALKMAEVFSLPSDHIVSESPPDGSEATKRPYKSQLSCNRLKQLGLYHQARSFAIGIKDCLSQFIN